MYKEHILLVPRSLVFIYKFHCTLNGENRSPLSARGTHTEIIENVTSAGLGHH